MLHRRFPALLLLPSLLLSSCGSAPDAPPARRFLTDDQGRALILRGVNVDSYAKSSVDRLPNIVEADAQAMAERWGFNFVRYLILWDALEPAAGMIDTAYLDAIGTRLDWFEAHGIKVMIDMHQDVYSAKSYSGDVCGDGAPDWAVRDDGLGCVPQSIWSFNYFQPGPTRAFDNFWAYDQGADADLQDHYAAAWRAVAARFGSHPAVIGYDLMNEPFPGSDFAYDVGPLAPNFETTLRPFDEGKLAPFYQRCIAAIREVDQDSYIFFEPRYGTPGDGSPSYLPRLDDPRRGERRLVYAPHMYSISLEATGQYDRTTDTSVSRYEAARQNELPTLDTSLIIGEWGLNQGLTGAFDFMDDFLTMADSLMAGWAYWSWDPSTGGWAFTARTYDASTGTVTYAENPNVDWIVRPYPRAIAGEPVSFSYDRQEREFDLVFDSKRGVSGPTEIYLPKQRFYANGYVVTSSDPDGSWSSTFDDVREVLSVTVPSKGRHEIHIAPAP